ncbi:MAG: molecular chaperone TorD family protein [Firmicutes bacterium]|nr:molecular chaperone TorD family protein [Bacillota bacterium]
MSINQETLQDSPQENFLVIINSARSQLYKILSKGFLYPQDETISYFADGVGNLISSISLSLPFNLKDTLETLRRESENLKLTELEELQAEYVRLFDYKPCCYITEAAYREHKALGDSTLEVNCFYRNAGLQVVMLEFPDHLGIELEFMHYLSYLATEAKEYKDTMENLATQLSFLEQHLSAWAPSLCLSIQAKTKSKFYKALADVGRQFIDLDYRYIKEISGALETH